mgnify:CR=1 FL=1
MKERILVYEEKNNNNYIFDFNYMCVRNNYIYKKAK